jgi:hypothetical protein
VIIRWAAIGRDPFASGQFTLGAVLGHGIGWSKQDSRLAEQFRVEFAVQVCGRMT